MKWLSSEPAPDTEGRVFRLLALKSLGAEQAILTKSAEELVTDGREDGGWAQLEDLPSDAYATGTVLYALHYTGTCDLDHPAWSRGIRYLLDSQREDGSWFVASRSKPFQPYYETGFPHLKDQFISTSATAWATIALLKSLPETTP